MTRKGIFGVLTVMLMFVLAGQTFASYYYNLTVPSFGRSSTTNNRVKQSNCSSIYLEVYSVGANYSLSAVPEEIDNDDVAGSASVTDGSVVFFPDNTAPCGAGEIRHMRFSSYWNTPVAVQVDGVWNPN